LYKGARQLTLINSFVLTFFLVIAIIATVFISIRFTSPIKELLRYMTKIQSGNMAADIEVTRSDEFGILATRFKVLMQNINNLIMREYRLELANKDNQLKALQAQINPHFLNNALQSIGTLALQHDAPRIYSLISSLAKMMRYSMNTHVIYVPFSKELDHVKSYLDLQKQRFEHQLEVSYQIEDATKAIEMPKMILQPIVENYFKHGFEPSLGTGKLLIASEIVEENAERRFHIRVENNGSGMTEDRLKEVTALLSNASDEKYIGLSNVLSRLRLYYNDSVSLDINLLAQGVQIHLTIPIEKEELR
jgi:two-component system, sensor histidine kinase YesM